MLTRTLYTLRIPRTPRPIPPPAFRLLLPAPPPAAHRPRRPGRLHSAPAGIRLHPDHLRRRPLPPLRPARTRRSQSTSGTHPARRAATKCPPLQQVWEQRQHDHNLRILGLFVPQGLDTEVEARQFVNELGLTFDFATDVRAQIAREYAVQYYPTTYFIDPAGRIHQMEISRLDAHRLTNILNTIPNP